MLRLMELRRPVVPCCSHSAIHTALHVEMATPLDGRTITRASAGAGSGPEHQAQRSSDADGDRVRSVWSLTFASTSATGTASIGAAPAAAPDRPEGAAGASGDAAWTPSARADCQPR